MDQWVFGIWDDDGNITYYRSSSVERPDYVALSKKVRETLPGYQLMRLTTLKILNARRVHKLDPQPLEGF